MKKFFEQDHIQFAERGIRYASIHEQLNKLQQDPDFTIIDRPCTIGDGIIRLTSTEIEGYDNFFRNTIDSRRSLLFVPASGASSRMFKELFKYCDKTDGEKTLPPFVGRKVEYPYDILNFFRKIKSFAFYEDLRTKLSEEGLNIHEEIRKNRYESILEALLTPSGLNFSQTPKALLPFHRYLDQCRTPIEEIALEATKYIMDSSKSIHVHFTVNILHKVRILEHLRNLRKQMWGNGIHLNATVSGQNPTTEKIAVDLDGLPFRDGNGKLLFRPGGHGALLDNLNDQQGDVIFIKNIDNIPTERLVQQTALYKRALGGYLVSIQKQIFNYLKRLSAGNIDRNQLREIIDFAKQQLSLCTPNDSENWPIKKLHDHMIDLLNRPLRVCGMIPNTNESGGGPYWVKNKNGRMSIQIVEECQINTGVPFQQSMLKNSTHFNPVEIVCGVKDYQGKNFDLRKFLEPHNGIITIKSHLGRELKALELPGLWNGTMALWNTIFVEVPANTFNPAKSILDLLRDEHQFIHENIDTN